jgi:PAS domain S-box-containing protein
MIYNNEINDFSEEWKGLLVSIEEFIEKKLNFNKLSDIFNYGLKVFLHLPTTEVVSLFMLSDSDFLFEHKYTIPNSYENQSVKLLDYLIENGVIGAAINNAGLYHATVNQEFSITKNLLIIPLKVSNGVIGVLILQHTCNFEDIKQITFKLITLFVNLFSATLENIQILQNIDNTKSVLEQKISQRTFDLSQNKRELKAILDSLLNGVIIVDYYSELITKVNPIASDLIGLKEDEILGRLSSKFLPVIDKSKLIEIDNCFKTVPFESELIDKSGIVVPIIRTITQLNLGSKYLIIESFVDISELKNYQQALSEANETLDLKVRERTEDLQLLIHKLKIEISERERAEGELRRLYEKEKELNELKSRFVSTISHEFRTPLTIIRSSAQMIQKFSNKISENEKHTYFDRIVRTVDYLTGLIENVIFIGKNDAQKLDLKFSLFSISDFIEKLIKDFQQTLAIERKFSMFKNPEINFIRNDERILWLILNNLISNAVKYSNSEHEIIIKIDKVNEYISISVQDFGIGIPEDEQSKIFDHFHRCSNVGSISGTGIGLSVVLESVTKLNGKIDILSNENQGSTFSVMIPILDENDYE